MEPIRTTPKDFFLYLFGVITLYVSATTLITLLWQLVNRAFPDAAAFTYGYDAVGDAIRLAVAILIVVFPAYLAAMWWIGKEVDAQPGKRELWVRRWFIWATLFIAALVVIGDLAVVLYAYLGGEIATRFVLKALAVAVVAKAVFWYHWHLLHREPGTGMAKRRNMVVAAVAFVGAAIVMAFVQAGTPGDARAFRNDQMRIGDLQQLQGQVLTYWQQKGALPQSAEETVDPAYPMPLPVDPETGVPYRYEATGTYEFRLCATFEAPYSEDQAVRDYSYATEVGVSAGNKAATWDHPAGEHCFVRVIDPDRYPVREPVPGVVPTR